MNSNPEAIEVVSTLDSDELRQLSHNYLHSHGVTFAVIPYSEKTRGVAHMAFDGDLLQIFFSNPHLVQTLFWGAASLHLGASIGKIIGKVFEGVAGEFAKDLYAWLKKSVSNTMRGAGQPIHRRSNPRGRVLVRFEGNLLIDRKVICVIVRLNYYTEERKPVEAPEDPTAEPAMSNMVDLVFGRVIPHAIAAIHLIGDKEQVDELRIEAYVPPDQEDIHIRIGHAYVDLDVHGAAKIHASPLVSGDIAQIFASFSRPATTTR